MLLSDHDILAEIRANNLSIDPFDPELVQPASVDVRLAKEFLVFDNKRHYHAYTDVLGERSETYPYTHVDPYESHHYLMTQVTVPGHLPFVLHPGEFTLASTVEKFVFPSDIAGRLEGRSSLGRMGLLTHATAGFIDPGFRGTITLELSNMAPLPMKLWPGMGIGQVCFFRMSSPVDRPYGSPGLGSRYQGQCGPRAFSPFDWE